MRQLWLDFGRVEKPYSREDIRNTLVKVIGDPLFVDKFFDEHIQGQTKPDFAALLAPAGLKVEEKDQDSAYVGKLSLTFDGKAAMVANRILINSPLYQAGVEQGDQIVKLGRREIRSQKLWDKALAQFKPGDVTTIEYIQRGHTVKKQIAISHNPSVKVVKMSEDELTEAQNTFLTDWLGADSVESTEQQIPLVQPLSANE